MPKPSDETKVRKFEVVNGDSYQLRALDFGIKGVKIELYDPRELDLLEEDRLHAVILTPQKARELFLWIGKL
ncbi:MAG: hypothetical protein JW837_18300 [Sedimentisphaerales bacterium]|nr:hypothetical protein [Sedimentisphaerales bacterium]